MAIEGVDFSKAHPTIAQLKAAGKKFACRYLTGTTSASPGSKNLTPTEAAALRAGGIDIVSNVETTEGFLLNGYNTTAKLAEACWKQHKWCGGPDNRPLYFSLDIDATLDQYKVALQGIKGAGSAIGWGNVGLYAGLFPIEWAHGDGVKWLWQALGWAYGGGTSKHALIRQYDNNVKLGSGTVDLDRAMVADYGQWGVATKPKETFMALTDDEERTILRAAQQILGAVAAGQTSFSETIEATLGAVQGLTNIVKGGQGSLAAGIADVRSAVLGAVAALPAPETSEQAQQAKDQILAALTTLGIEGVSADAVLDALAQRLAA